MDSPEVAIVLDEDADEAELLGLLGRMPVWAVDSVSNRKVAEKYWRSNVPLPPMTERGISLFTVQDYAEREKNLEVALSLIDDHHNEYAANPPYSCLIVNGIALSPETKSVCEQFGFSRFEVVEGGFRCSAE